MSYRIIKLYHYVCELCKKKRQTQKEQTSIEKLCRKCRPIKIPENQTSIFDLLGDKPVETGDKNL